SEYRSPGGQIFHQRQDKVYIFAEYFRRFGKWSATAGMGVQYTDYLFKESNRGNHSWSPRPQATITYSLNQNHNFRLNFTSWQSTPSLAETNIVPQQLDGFQWREGNQDLKTANSYMLTLRYGFNLPRVSGSFGIRAFTSPNAITPLLRWDDDRLVTTYENSRGLQNLSFFLAPQIDIIPGGLMASGYIQYRMERMRGTGYSLNSNAWSGNAAIQLMHWGFVLSGQYVRAQRDLWGEKISWGEDLNLIDLSYNWKSWQFSAGIIMPFGKYDQGSKSLSYWNNNEQHMRFNMRMPYIAVSYNLQWGRQKRGAQKLVDVNADADRSTAGGR
ncbi:MAG: outer membrane beta-barrel family protein, partial [Muribaculaceae bacterium]|nr:outer membrane beta-barrel family protein [Muribaculaceae bacterium]